MALKTLRIVLLGLILGGICAAPAAFGQSGAQSGAQSGSTDAKIVDFTYSPLKQTVDAGTTISWANNGARPHTVTDRGGAFDTGPVSPGASSSITLNVPGHYFFFCRINPSKMNGELVVKATGEQKAVRVQAVDPAREGGSLSFDPDEIEVKAGTAVTLANVGGKPHSLTADDGSFDTGIVNPGAQGGRFAGNNATIVPTKAGTFPFHCEVHPEAMKGVLTVTGTPPPGVAAPANAPNKAEVKIVDFAFDPKETSVAPGGTVTWKNTGKAPHTATFDDVDKLDTGQLAPGLDGSLVAPAQPGSYSYRCTVHPAKMRGVLVVVGQNSTDPTKTQAVKAQAASASGPGGGVSFLASITGVIGAFAGGFGLSRFVGRPRPAA